MMDLVHDYVGSSRLLSRKLGNYGSSSTLLGVIGFEIALKVVHMAETGTRARSHDYWEIWSQLEAETQDEIKKAALKRNAGHVDLSELQKVLAGIQKVFAAGRYSYEFTQGETAIEAAERGRRWEENGAPLSEADICYYPMEVDSLTFGLICWIEDRFDLSLHWEE